MNPPSRGAPAGGRCDLQRSSGASLTCSAGPQGRWVWPGAGGGKGKPAGSSSNLCPGHIPSAAVTAGRFVLLRFSNCTPCSARRLRIYVKERSPLLCWTHGWQEKVVPTVARGPPPRVCPLGWGAQGAAPPRSADPVLLSPSPDGPMAPCTSCAPHGSPRRVTRLQPLCHRGDGAGRGSRRRRLPRTLFHPDVSSPRADAAPQHPTLKSPTSPGP